MQNLYNCFSLSQIASKEFLDCKFFGIRRKKLDGLQARTPAALHDEFSDGFAQKAQISFTICPWFEFALSLGRREKVSFFFFLFFLSFFRSGWLRHGWSRDSARWRKVAEKIRGERKIKSPRWAWSFSRRKLTRCELARWVEEQEEEEKGGRKGKDDAWLSLWTVIEVVSSGIGRVDWMEVRSNDATPRNSPSRVGPDTRDHFTYSPAEVVPSTFQPVVRSRRVGYDTKKKKKRNILIYSNRNRRGRKIPSRRSRKRKKSDKSKVSRWEIKESILI